MSKENSLFYIDYRNHDFSVALTDYITFDEALKEFNEFDFEDKDNINKIECIDFMFAPIDDEYLCLASKKRNGEVTTIFEKEGVK